MSDTISPGDNSGQQPNGQTQAPNDSEDVLALMVAQARAQLSTDAQEALAAITTRQEFARGERMPAEGPIYELHHIISGQIRLFYQRPNGKELLVSIMGPGDLFTTGLDVTSGRISQAESMVPSVVDSLDMLAAGELTIRHPELSNFFLLSLMRLTQLLAGRVEALLSGDASTKVAHVLADLVTRVGKPHANGGVALTDGINQSDLAGMSGIRRETANKTLAELSSHGWTETDGHTIVIRDLAALRRAAHGIS